MQDYIIEEKDSIFNNIKTLFSQGLLSVLPEYNDYTFFEKLFNTLNNLSKEIYFINNFYKKDVFLSKFIIQDNEYSLNKIYAFVDNDSIQLNTNNYFYFSNSIETYLIDKTSREFNFFIKNNLTNKIYYSFLPLGCNFNNFKNLGNIAFISQENICYIVKEYTKLKRANIEHNVNSYRINYQGSEDKDVGIELSNIIKIQNHEKIDSIEKKIYKGKESFHIKFRNSQFSSLSICNDKLIFINITKKTKKLIKKNINYSNPLYNYFDSSPSHISYEILDKLNFELSKIQEVELLKNDYSIITIDDYLVLKKICINVIKEYYYKFHLTPFDSIKSIDNVFSITNIKDSIEKTQLNNVSIPIMILKKKMVKSNKSLITEVENIISNINNAFDNYSLKSNL